jgi:ABC-type phosphate/phosphonate transport system substrate-binding protein
MILMASRNLPGLALAALAACLLGGALLHAGNNNNNSPIRIGMVRSFFTDVPKVLVDLVTEPFGPVMKQATGYDGKLFIGGDAFEVASQLDAKKLEFGVFHSFEFAWAQQKYADLKPLMVVVNKTNDVRASILVKKDNNLASLADLKGKDLAIPKRTKEQCRVFLDKACGMHAPKAFFGNLVASANVETALDDLCSGKVQGALMDSLAIEFYQDLKPGLFAKLKVLTQSESFPPAVIAYKQGTLDEATLGKFRAGLLTAHTSDLGREMLGMWKIRAFEAVPADYSKSLAEILKAYPAPEAPAKVSLR